MSPEELIVRNITISYDYTHDLEIVRSAGGTICVKNATGLEVVRAMPRAKRHRYPASAIFETLYHGRIALIRQPLARTDLSVPGM